jgi:Holliday junction resolvase RusA-like endonuclease
MSIRFEMAMPDSWSKKKKNKFEGKPHLVKPDMDNMLKSLQDCLLTNDSGIWWYERLQKVWAREGRIIIEKLC